MYNINNGKKIPKKGKNMKKINKITTIACMAIVLLGCSTTKDSSKGANILVPTGAPSLGFVSEYTKIKDNGGTIDFVDGSDQLVAELSKNDSTYDIIVAPINLGAKLIESKQTEYRIASIITWGNLYYIGTSEEALQQTGKLALFGQGTVPQKIVDSTNIETTLTPTYYNSATLVQQQLLSGNDKVGLLAEPLASATIAKAKQAGISLSIIKDLQKEYGEGGYPQAAIFVKDGKNYQDLFTSIDTFTNNNYPDLQKYLETISIETLKLPSIDITIKSMERQNVHYKKATKVKEEIQTFLKLFNIKYDDTMLVS